MSIKKWIAVSSLIVTTALVSMASIAGYDTRGEGYYNRRCNTTDYFNYTHKYCMSSCSARHGSEWQNQERYNHFRACYEGCTHEMNARCGRSGEHFPRQPFSPPSI